MRNVKIFWNLLLRAGKNPSDIPAFIQGHYRQWLFYSPWFGWLLASHIRSQINFRLKVMDRDCYETGECKMCRCDVPALQMADKACEKPCYPPMISRKGWPRLEPIVELMWQYDRPKYFNVIKSITNELEGRNN